MPFTETGVKYPDAANSTQETRPPGGRHDDLFGSL
jgi:hypothetical protein